MKWFKHLTGSIKDPLISDLIAEFGGDGYLVFFGLLDLMADDFNVNNPGIVTFSCQYVTKNLQVSRQKFIKIMTFIEKYPKEKGKILAEFRGEMVTLKCMRLKDLCDIWTQKQLRSGIEVTSKLLRPKEGEEEGEEEGDKGGKDIPEPKEGVQNPPDLPPVAPPRKPRKPKVVPPYSEQFLRFWEVYPRKISKENAFKAWLKKQCDGIADLVIDSVSKQLAAGMLDTREGMIYCPHAATWLNAKRWEDEIQTRGKDERSNVTTGGSKHERPREEWAKPGTVEDF